MAAVKRSAKTATAGIAAAALLFGPAASATAEPQAEASAEPLLSFVGPKKLKVAKSFSYIFVCPVNCNFSARDSLKGKGAKVTGALSGTLAAGVPGGVRLKPNGPLLKALKDNTGTFKLAVTVTATDPATGETDTDKRTYKFK